MTATTTSTATSTATEAGPDTATESTATESATPGDSTAAPSAPDLRPRTGSYRTGACGGSLVNGVFITHSERLHRLCNGASGLCSCPCHHGVAVWEGAQQMFSDAVAGRRVTVVHDPRGTGGPKKRNLGKRSSARR